MTTVIEDDATKSKKVVHQIPVVYHDPDRPIENPPQKAVSVILGGSTHGDNKDKNRGFAVNVCAAGIGNENVVASQHSYCYGGAIKDGAFPSERLTNLNSFSVPTQDDCGLALASITMLRRTSGWNTQFKPIAGAHSIGQRKSFK